MRKGLRAATGGGIYDMMDAQASRQDSSVQARNREEQPYPGAMSQNMPGMAGGGKLLANRVKAMRRFLARGPKSELLPRSARQKTAAATGAGLVGAKAAGDVIAEHTGPGAKMNYRNMHKNAAEAPMVNPLKFKYHDPSTWPKKAHGGELSIKAIKRLKPFRAKGKITPNDPPETMRYGGKFRARLKR